jgi:uncharacterized membrane protein
MRKRSVAKAISWETFSNAVCLGLAYIMFGNFGGCLVFTGIAFLVKLVLFYYHDLIWSRINWGKWTVYDSPSDYKHFFDDCLLPPRSEK